MVSAATTLPAEWYTRGLLKCSEFRTATIYPRTFRFLFINSDPAAPVRRCRVLWRDGSIRDGQGAGRAVPMGALHAHGRGLRLALPRTMGRPAPAGTEQDIPLKSHGDRWRAGDPLIVGALDMKQLETRNAA